MASLMEKKDNNQVLLTIDVAADIFADALQQSYRKNAKKFNVPGFRKGKAPMGLVTKYYGEGVLYEDAIDIAAMPAYTDALKEHSLDPVAQPEMDIVEIGKENGLKFTVLLTVKPEVELGQYLGVEAVKPDYPVSDDDVEKELKRVQERNSRLIPVEDRPVEDGDTVNIDYKGFLNDEPFEGGEASSYDLKIGSKTFIPGFEEQLIGHETGEKFDIDVTFPDDYGNEDLKGQKVIFNVTINAIKVRELPELDDEFAKDVSEFDTLEEYRADQLKKLQENAQKRADGEFEENVIQAVVGNATVDIPEVMVEQEVNRMVEEQKNQMRYQGIELEQYLGYMGQTIETFREQLKETAQNRVKSRLVLEAIAAKEEISADAEEIESEIERLAGMYNMKPEEIRERIDVDENGFVQESIISRKTVEKLNSAAVAIAPPPPAEDDGEKLAAEDETAPAAETSEVPEKAAAE